MSKFIVKSLLPVFILTALLSGGCRQTPPTVAPNDQTSDAAPSPIRVSAVETDAAEPAITADADGSFYVVYVAHGADKTGDVYLQKYDAQMKAAGEKTRVNPNQGEATAWRGDAPTIKVGADKTVYVGWTKSVVTSRANGTDLCLSVSRDGGKSFAAPVKINDDIKPASHGMHSLAVGANKQVFVAWLDERNLKNAARAQSFDEAKRDVSDFRFVKIHHNSNRAEPPKKVEQTEAAEPNSEVFFARSSDGGATFSANAKLSSEVCPCCKTALAVAPDGRIYASWRQVLPGDYRHIAVASSVDDGANFSAPTIVSDDRWQINACPVSGAALAARENEPVKVVWFTAGDAGEIGLYEAESDDFAKTFSDRVLISEGNVSAMPTLAANADDLEIFWEAEGKIFQSAMSANRETAKTKLIADGNLPAVAAFGEKRVAAYVKKESGKRAVWLARF